MECSPEGTRSANEWEDGGKRQSSRSAYQLVSVVLASAVVSGLVGPTASALSYPGFSWNATSRTASEASGRRSASLNSVEGSAQNLCSSDRLAVFKVVLHTYWTRDLFPKHYPDWRPPAQWSNTIG